MNQLRGKPSEALSVPKVISFIRIINTTLRECFFTSKVGETINWNCYDVHVMEVPQGGVHHYLIYESMPQYQPHIKYQLLQLIHIGIELCLRKAWALIIAVLGKAMTSTAYTHTTVWWCDSGSCQKCGASICRATYFMEQVCIHAQYYINHMCNYSIVKLIHLEEACFLVCL